MDTAWFAARMQLLGIVQEDVARALSIDRSTVSRVQTGSRPLTIAEVEPLAAVIKVPAIEVIEHAHEWTHPIRTETEIRADLLQTAVRCAMIALELDEFARDVAETAVALYGQLLDSEAANGQPLASDERVLRLIADTLRRVRRATTRRSE